MRDRSTAGFFDNYAQDFDAIYGRENTLVNRVISKFFRRSMRLRFQRTIEGCQPVEGKSALDIGCGPGHYAVALAHLGAAEVVGIDFAPSMIALAKAKADQAEAGHICRFIVDDFMTYDFERVFDYAILMGFMDYVSDPREVIKRALSLTTTRAFFSFPAAEGILAWQRRRRYRNRCDLFMYRRQEIPRLFEGLTFKNIKIGKLSRDYFITVDV